MHALHLWLSRVASQPDADQRSRRKPSSEAVLSCVAQRDCRRASGGTLACRRRARPVLTCVSRRLQQKKPHHVPARCRRSPGCLPTPAGTGVVRSRPAPSRFLSIDGAELRRLPRTVLGRPGPFESTGLLSMSPEKQRRCDQRAD